ncbi:PIN domain-containing protein [Gloeocapsa sp. PCC 73106]|uniref:PIN domain-containing protein n=1 Tax=Gloeocapsa sp. PCC 73106 TaxID=102232 RepID=UPI0002ABA623|nr:type II toxin-antitoxin system VapC family toxin [Gloeocapsa sp. PCC 73106]ELR98761.1 putative nucleic-acid-binding protein [Gloeocapsa sp. PCC 73106]
MTFALDTNVLIRYIIQDDPEQAQKASEAIEQLTAQKQGFISCIVLCELNWVLKTAYKISKNDRVATLQRIFSVPAFDIEQLDCCVKALRRYEKGQADFSDYLIQQIAEQHGYKNLLTFDQKAFRETGFQSASQ